MDVQTMKRLSVDLKSLSEQVQELAEHEEREQGAPLGVLMRRTAERIIIEAGRRPDVKWFDVAGDWMLAQTIDLATGRVEGGDVQQAARQGVRDVRRGARRREAALPAPTASAEGAPVSAETSAPAESAPATAEHAA